MANKQNFEKEKVQIQWTTAIAFKEDAKIPKEYEKDAEQLMNKIVAAKDEWSFEFKLTYDKKKEKAGISGIQKIIYPQTNNGHQGESGHNGQWQLDVATAGKGSKVRLYAGDVTATVSKVKQEDDKIKVGKDDYIVVTCDVKVTGSYTAGQKH